VKGVILSMAPGCQLVDLTHEVLPQAVLEGCFLLETAWRYFPPGTIHLVVVDPGVGTPRGRIALECEGHFFVGPDNGCLSAALPASMRGARRPGEPYAARPLPLPADITAVSIDSGIVRQPVSATFEGRDVFAPAAAVLARGARLADLGPRVERLACFPAFQAPLEGPSVYGQVIHTDRFGNLITDIRIADLALAPRFEVAGRQIDGLTRTFAEATGLAAVGGSSGLVEIVMPNGSAAALLGIGLGTRVTATV
jgi:S-adenosylmethionine hydrolase